MADDDAIEALYARGVTDGLPVVPPTLARVQAAVRASGRLAYPSGNRAVTALGHLYRDARHRARRGR